jgi:tetratricopeptide (TPR) repeat protein
MLVLCLAPLAVPSWRQALLRHSQATADAWDDRWTRRVERGEALLAAERFDEAAAHLEALDRRFPAPLVKYGRDGERERLLRALGTSHAALGRKRRTLETYRRLVAYDPLNYLNHVALAEAALRFDEPDEALAHFEEVLRFHPGHLPSLRAVVGARVEAGEWRAGVDAYERYLDTFQLERIELQVGSRRAQVQVPVDGRWHEVEAVLRDGKPADTALGGPALLLRPGPNALEVASLALTGPLAVGETGPPPRLALQAPVAWELRNAEPTASAPTLRLALPPETRDWVAARLRVRLFKPVDPELWRQVAAAYRNLLDWEGLEAAQGRSDPAVAASEAGPQASGAARGSES